MIVVLKALIYKAIKDELVKAKLVRAERVDGDTTYYWHRTSTEKAYRHHINEHSDSEIDLTALTRKQCESLLAILEAQKVHGSKVLAADLQKYLRASDNGIDNIRARTCRQAAWLLELYFAHLPQHLLFAPDEYGGNSHTAYWVGEVSFHDKYESHGTMHPEHTDFNVYWIDKDVRKKGHYTLYKGECHEMTCVEILAKQGLRPETPQLVETLLDETRRFYAKMDNIGEQHLATGIGVLDLDCETTDDDDDEGSGFWRRKKYVELDAFDKPARVVVDVAHETDNKKKDESDDASIDPWRWHRWNMRFHAPSEKEIIQHLEADEDTADAPEVFIPVHPLVPCFDLRRHKRLRVHINNLKPYEYNKKVAKNLVLPERDWKMVNLLVDHSANTFQDIVSSKGQSMNVLAVGRPGTGKTATAEVFAEFKERPLYTVQCSQLGMEPDTVENNLSVIMRRANRWNAVLLLDEADVYIRKRGEDLNQNAIVGAFLRVLEYASCILFMTSNLGDEIDDAITSRCIAKLTYEIPGKQDQARIWRVLADLNKLPLKDSEIAKITDKHPHLSGRDCKNLLKLASFVAESEKRPLDAKTIEYAMQFKPTENFGDSNGEA